MSNKKPASKNPKNAAAKKNLTARETKFVEEMAKPDVKSATDAARKAGYSENSAKQIASENLTKPYLLDAIEKRRKEVIDFHKVSAEEIYGSAIREMYSSIDDVLDANGQFDIKKARRTGAIHNVKEIIYRPSKYGVSISVKMNDAAAARRELSDYIGLKQKPRENDETLEKVVLAFQNWLEDNSDASKEEKVLWLQRFAKGGGVDETELAKRVGVKIQEINGVQ
ncbi:MAG: terminase small subunit [Acidobacteria bacterium]|nr:terminase small subunit [Acidobacteriota bacterium]MCA1639622.1 terminase small subunit [Acidobacteriota bacterium]